MRPASAIATCCLLLAGLAGCAHEPPTAAAPEPAAPAAAPPPRATPPAAPAETPHTPVSPATPPAPAATGSPDAASVRAAAPGGPPRPSPRPRAPAQPPAPVTVPAAAARTPAPAARPAAPALDLAALEQRLRDTHAIGLFTKLSLKNQVDDLLAEFRGYYDGRARVTLAELRRSYELLLMKVVTLLQDGDPALAVAVSSSRDAIWAMLADRKSFTNLDPQGADP